MPSVPPLRIGLVGDRDDAVTAHRAIPDSLALAAGGIGRDVALRWLDTPMLADCAEDALAGCDGLWCVPGSPYRSADGALTAIRHARERGVPFLGTCAGFQHALIEHARNVVGLEDADHEESRPAARTKVVTRLACALVEVEETVALERGSRAWQACGSQVRGTYRCSFGANPSLEPVLAQRGLAFTGRAGDGQPRVLERAAHPFFLATLFQPERAALEGSAHPLVRAFVEAAAARA